MQFFKAQDRKRSMGQHGINMVDLMMWLVIAALLLAAALQSISFYQRASFVHQMVSDLDGVGSMVMSESAVSGGALTKDAVERAAIKAKWSTNVSYSVEGGSSNGKPYLRALHPYVTNTDAVYMFEACGSYKIGVNVVPKGAGDAVCGVGASPGHDPAFQTVTWSSMTGAGAANWADVDSSDDGKTVLASTLGGYLSVSYNGGDTWTQRTAAGTANWGQVAVSGDGKKMFAVKTGNDGSIFMSSDSGATWTHAASAGNGSWNPISVSDNGRVVIAAIDGGNMSRSNDGGATWTVTSAPIAWWRNLAMSSDSSIMLGGPNGGDNGYPHISTDGGLTWTENRGPGHGSWRGLDVSDSGRILVATSHAGEMFISGDYGQTWKKKTGVGTGKQMLVAMSDDASKIAAAEVDGRVWTSVDFGATWKERTEMGSGSWTAIATSANGSSIFVSANSGNIRKGAFGS